MKISLHFRFMCEAFVSQWQKVKMEDFKYAFICLVFIDFINGSCLIL
jgi:hypothetical protein